MLNDVDLGVLNLYQKRIEKLHTMFGHQCWPLLYQTDVRARSELVPDKQLELIQAHMAGVPLGKVTYDPQRPYNAIMTATGGMRSSKGARSMSN